MNKMNTPSSTNDKANVTYSAFSHNEQNISKELMDIIKNDYRVLPLFEKTLADDAFAKHHSLNNNNDFAFKWIQYKNAAATRVHVPIDFPNVRDYHFYKYHNCYKPSESINNRVDYRYRLGPGPGYDAYGEIPIPVDSNLRLKRKLNERRH